jgi:hypothetical protein
MSRTHFRESGDRKEELFLDRDLAADGDGAMTVDAPCVTRFWVCVDRGTGSAFRATPYLR